MKSYQPAARVMIQPAEYATCREAIDQAFAAFPLSVTGKRVLVKPNCLRGSRADEGIVTHPSVLRAVVEKVETLRPAALIVGDNPGVVSYGQNEESFEKTGLKDAAKGYYKNIGLESAPVPFDPEIAPTVNLSQAILDADVIISLPKFKTHGLTVMTGAIKNSYGFLPGAQKAKLHKKAGSPERFHEVIVDVFRLRVPDLFIVDAVIGMEGNGPASPDLVDIGQILASDNGVALDAVIATMMGVDPGCLRFLQKAAEYGLGDYRMDRIEILGELISLPDFKIPPLGGEAIIGNKKVQEMLHSKIDLCPEPDPTLCTACGACVDQCPVSALTMAENLPVADGDVCIRCFCCQEICPEKAMSLK